MEDAGFLEELLLHVQVVAPIARLQESGIVVKTRLDQATQCSQGNEEEEDGPANSLDRVRRA